MTDALRQGLLRLQLSHTLRQAQQLLAELQMSDLLFRDRGCVAAADISEASWSPSTVCGALLFCKNFVIVTGL